MGHFEFVGQVAEPTAGELIVRAIEALAWPLVVLIGIYVLRPQTLLSRIADKLINDGGELTAGNVSLSVPAKIAKVADQLDEHKVGEEEQKLAQRAEDTQQPDTPEILYARIIDAWGELAEAMWATLEEKTGESVSLRAPRQLIEKLVNAGVIRRKVGEELEELLDIRNLVKRNGVGGFEDLELSEEDTLRYAASAAALQKAYFS